MLYQSGNKHTIQEGTSVLHLTHFLDGRILPEANLLYNLSPQAFLDVRVLREHIQSKCE